MENLEIQAYEMVKSFVYVVIASNPTLDKLKKYSMEDLASDCYTHLLERNYFKRFNPQITTFAYFIKVGVRNYLIDRSRKKESSVSYVDMSDLPEEIFFREDPDFDENCDDRLARFEDKRLPSAKGYRSDRKLVSLLMEGYSKKEISEMWGVTTVTVDNQIKRILVDAMRA